MAGPVRIFTMADDAYAMALAVTVRSLLESFAADRPLVITVADGGISAENRGRLDDSWAGIASSCRIDFVAPRYPAAEVPVRGRMSLLTYARLALAEYFPADAERVVLLDSDLLVLADVAALYDMDLGTATLAAARDPYIRCVASPNGLADWRELGLAPDAPYFNAGVFVADLQRWRADRVTSRCFEYVRRMGARLRLFDQDALNATLAGSWKTIDDRWQVHPRTRWSLGHRVPCDPRIVHFSGRLKPWLYASSEAVDRLFFDVLDRTAWRGTRYRPGLRPLAMRLYDSPLRRLCYPLELRAGALLRSLTSPRWSAAGAERM